jgi:two-component system, NtrC family, response regulator AtoC
VCIYGESGTGKELVARAIHANSLRAATPFIPVDCASLPENLLESELFGHDKGAFTGAVRAKSGLMEVADGGTLFLDEIGELPVGLQSKFLRALQERQIRRVGGTALVDVDVRVVSATNRDIREAILKGTFRKELYYRVNVIEIEVPPLRERPDDIPALVQYFIQKYARAHRKTIHGITPAAMDRIVSSSWPGNVRHLQNCIEQAVVLTDAEILRERDLCVTDRPARRVPACSGDSDIDAGVTLHEMERRLILKTLDSVHRSRTRAAKILGISVRALQYKLKAYGEDDKG